MSQIKVDSEDIAKIKDALTIIKGNAEFLVNEPFVNKPQQIIKQVKRIYKLLPKEARDDGSS